jgi:hypothetical protein
MPTGVRPEGRRQVVIAIVTALLVLGVAAPPTVVGSARPPAVWIVDAQNIVPASGIAMAQQEANRIWSRYGVELRWSRRLPDAPDLLMLVVVVNGTTDEHAPLGHVTRVGGTFRRQIVVSDRAIVNLLIASGVHRTDPGWETLYSRMFARVLSHELGHLLLNSAAHSATGLMRARFARDDVKSSTEDRFSLEAADAATIRAAVVPHMTLATECK